MTRRDIIIIAVLANIGVLAIMFMLAFRTDGDKSAEQPEIDYTIVEETPAVQTDEVIAKSDPADEVDTVLDDVSSAMSSRDLTTDDDVLPLADNEPAQKSDVQPTEATNDGNDRFVEVTIKRGDVLEKIAKANGTTVSAIKKANNLQTDRLKIGQVLQVPVGTKKKSTDNTKTVAAAKPTASTDVQYYTIKNGDNPWKIAKQFHMKVDELLKLNGLDEDKARNLKIGDQIRVK